MYKISANTLFTGKKCVYLPTCHSTNDIATRILSNDDTIEGTVVVTPFQTKGRGQRGNSWETEADQNLTFSVILKPGFLMAAAQFQLNMAVSLGIFDFLFSFLSRGVKIKWPNDIYVGDKKIAGILFENYLKKNKIDNSIVGIGININQSEFETPNAISLSKVTGKKYKLRETIELVLEKIEARYLQLKAGTLDKMKHDYLQELYWYQEWRSFEDMRTGQAEPFEGQILGVDKWGKLAIETKKSGVVYFDFKQVVFVK
ncbi:biotin--[acetyl-CoA-carboxylase] ligase [Flammeovirgaceae bacterium SG7u.111]|nr:biotin--[acetyl-CoA-carboxylase] ligase [Flammeovirgaceae bacterium SG7u.132]WPO35675.1 biotin--[acetyl-CoA-carboxylase] ligase [Flammeovirgaceae bacterium SG7u.111]